MRNGSARPGGLDLSAHGRRMQVKSTIRFVWMTLILSVLSMLVIGCGPIGPFSGGRLSGQMAPWPGDWNAATSVTQIQLETAPDDPHSVNVWVVVLEGEAFIVTSLLVGTQVPTERAWVRNIASDPRIRVRVDGIVYPARLEALEDSAQIAIVLEAFRTKYPELKASRAEGARFFQIVKRADVSMP